MVLPCLAPSVLAEELVLVPAAALCRLASSQHVACPTNCHAAELFQGLFTHSQQLWTMPCPGLVLAGHTLVTSLSDDAGMRLTGDNSAPTLYFCS